MQTLDLNCYLAAVEARKVELDFDEGAGAVAARRNNGARRTPAKRRMLARTAERAEAAGLAPLPAIY
tara:strand:+ start:308 stop:508 length:201 start_codon:yes stop_codon:yes gene_type:complete